MLTGIVQCLDLKEKRNVITGNPCWIKTGNENILITSYLTGSLLNDVSPDIVDPYRSKTRY